MIYNVGASALRPPAAPQQNSARLKKVCSDFESLFIRRLLEMQTAPADACGFLGGNEIVRSMFRDHLSRSIATAGGLGLGEALYRHFHAAEGEIRSSSGASESIYSKKPK